MFAHAQLGTMIGSSHAPVHNPHLRCCQAFGRASWTLLSPLISLLVPRQPGIAEKMSVFVDGSGDDIRAAYEDVRSDESETNWWVCARWLAGVPVLFGISGKQILFCPLLCYKYPLILARNGEGKDIFLAFSHRQGFVARVSLRLTSAVISVFLRSRMLWLLTSCVPFATINASIASINHVVLLIRRACFLYEDGGQGKKIEHGGSGTDYDELLALLGGMCVFVFVISADMIHAWETLLSCFDRASKAHK